MDSREIFHLLIAILVLAIVISFANALKGNFLSIGLALLFAFLIIAFNVVGKKIAASSLDVDVENELWFWERYGLKPGWHLEKPIPLGVILPLVLTAFSVGIVKCMTLITYETKALKRRAARRFGFYSFAEMTDWHTSLIGAAGIVAVLILAVIAYFIPGIEGLTKMAIYYSFWNLIPFSKLDGSQIFFGSRVIWTALALITIIATAYALVLV